MNPDAQRPSTSVPVSDPSISTDYYASSIPAGVEIGSLDNFPEIQDARSPNIITVPDSLSKRQHTVSGDLRSGKWWKQSLKRSLIIIVVLLALGGAVWGLKAALPGEKPEIKILQGSAPTNLPSSDSSLQNPGTITVNRDFLVSGDAKFQQNINVQGNATLQKNLIVQGNSNVGGNLNINGNGEVQGNLNVVGNGTFTGTIKAANFSGDGSGLTNIKTDCTNCVHLQTGSLDPETGSISISGLLDASSLQGSGAGISAINASNLSSGTLADTRLSANVALLSASNTFSGVINNFASILQNGNVVCDASNNCGYAGGGAAAFVQGGNSFGALAVIGTNDNNDLSIRTSGAEAIRILANGNVGIGTTAPTAPLSVFGTVFDGGSDPAILRIDGIATSTTRQQNGLTSLLTASPLAPSSQHYIGINSQITSNSANIANARIFGLASYPIIYGSAAVNDVMGAYFSGEMNDTSSANSFTGLFIDRPYGTGSITTNTGLYIASQISGINNAGAIIGEATGTNQSNLIIGQTTIPTGMYSIYNSSTDQNYFAGNVGIGTTIMPAALNVQGNHASGIGLAQFKGNSNFGYISTDTTNIATSWSGYLTKIDGVKMGELSYDTVTSALNLYNFNASSAPMVSLADSGNVGIGTTNPTLGNLQISTTAPASVSHGALLNLNGTLTSTTNQQLGIYSNPAIAPTGGTSNQYYDAIQGAPTTSAILTAGMTGVSGYPIVTGSGNVASLGGAYFGGEANTNSTVGTYIGTFIDTIYKFGGATVSNTYGLQAESQSSGSNNNVGIAINEASGGNNTNLLVGTFTVPTGSYSIYNSSPDQNYFAGNLGIGVTNPSNKLSVAGNANITGHAAIGANSAVNNGTLLNPGFTYNNLLSLQETFTDLNSSDYTQGITNYLNLNPSANYSGFPSVYGIDNQLVIEAGNDKNLYYLQASSNIVSHQGTGILDYGWGVDGRVFNTSSGTIAEARGANLTVANTSSGTIGQSYGAHVVTYNFGTGTIGTAYSGFFAVRNLGSGTFNDGRAVYVGSPVNSGGGTFNNNYGLYIEDQSAVGSTNSFNLYSAGAASKNYFSGNVGIGTGSPTAKLHVEATRTDSSGNAEAGILSYLKVDPAASGTIGFDSGYFTAEVVNGNSNNLTSWGYIRGLTGATAHSGTGTVGNAYGIYGEIANFNTGTITNASGIEVSLNNYSTGKITNGYALKIDAAYNPSGTFDNNYGLYIQDQSAVGSVSSYNLYSEGANSKNYFAGSVGIGTTNPTLGNLQITTTPPDIYKGAQLMVNGTFTSTTNPQYGIFVNPTISPSSASNQSYDGIQSAPTTSSPNLSGGKLAGITGFPYLTGSGNVATLFGSYFGSSLADTSTANTYYGVYIDTAYPDVGASISNTKGLFVESQNTGSISNVGIILKEAAGGNNTNLLIGTDTVPVGSYSIHNASTDQNYFAGNVGIGDANPANKLSVTGNANIIGHAAIGSDALVDDCGNALFGGSLACSSVLNVAERVTYAAGANYTSGISSQLLLDASGSISATGNISGYIQTAASNPANYGNIIGVDSWANHQGGGTTPYLGGVSTGSYKSAGAGNVANSTAVYGYADGGNLTHGLYVESYKFTSNAPGIGSLFGGYLNANNTLASSSGIDDTYGLFTTVTRTGATGGILNTYGAMVDMGTLDNAGAGTHNAYSLYLKSPSGADINYALFSPGAANSYFAGNIGLYNNSPANKLNLNTLTTADASAELAVSTGGVNNKGMIIQAVAGQNADLFQAQDSAGAVLASISNIGNLSVKNAVINGSLSVNGHIITANATGTTTIAAGAAACIAPTVSLAGNDTSGTISVTTGTGCAATGVLGTVTFANAYGAAPQVVLTPANASATDLKYYSGAEAATTFTLDTNNVAQDATIYTYNYHILQ